MTLDLAALAAKVKGYLPRTFNDFELGIMAAWEWPYDVVVAESHIVRWINTVATGISVEKLLDLHSRAGVLLTNNAERKTSPMTLVHELRELIGEYIPGF